MIDIGVVHGRFQILHHDHLKYILAAKAECRHLVVAITNPDPMLTREDPADPQRSRPAANPLTYYERYTMVRQVLREAELAENTFSTVPLPINFPERYRYYTPTDATYFMTIYDPWGRHKKQQFESLGLKTHVLWEKPAGEKGITATEVRRCMVQKLPWEHLVPGATARLMKLWRIPDRLRKLTDHPDV